MKENFKPLPDDVPPMTKEQFLKRLTEDPSFVETMRGHYEAALALPENEDTAELQEKARAALRTLKHQQGLWHGSIAMKKLQAMMEQGVDYNDPQVVLHVRTLCDEARDHFLDTLEPERTSLMARVAKVRLKIHDIFGPK